MYSVIELTFWDDTYTCLYVDSPIVFPTLAEAEEYLRNEVAASPLARWLVAGFIIPGAFDDLFPEPDVIEVERSYAAAFTVDELCRTQGFLRLTRDMQARVILALLLGSDEVRTAELMWLEGMGIIRISGGAYVLNSFTI